MFRSVPTSAHDLAGSARLRARKRIALAEAQRLKQERSQFQGGSKAVSTQACSRTGRNKLSFLFMLMAVAFAFVAVVTVLPRGCGDANALTVDSVEGVSGIIHRISSLGVDR